MPITYEIRENGYVIFYVMTDPWTVADLLNNFAAETVYRDQAGHQVHTLVDLRLVHTAPTSGLIGVRNKVPSLVHPTAGQFVVIGANIFMHMVGQTIFNLLAFDKGKFVNTEEEAWTFLRSIIPG
jgi:hypothetical protein